jgi:hypothetical protein
MTAVPPARCVALLAVALGVLHAVAAGAQPPNDLSLVGLEDDCADPGSDEHRPDAIEQTGRTLRIGVRWTIGRPR